ncbi:MAG TPA: hypothetical protein ENJ12_09800, partial [Thiolapillus brandeum]|nr:hypothetical protein [Thiolapillus brandeum]
MSGKGKDSEGGGTIHIPSIAKEVSWVLGGRVANSVLAFATGVIIGRALGPESFGLYTFFVTVLILGMELAASEGLNIGLVHHVAKLKETDEVLAVDYLRAALQAKMMAGILFVMVAAALVLLAFHWFDLRQEIWLPLWFGISGAFFASMWRGTLAGLQAQRQFSRYAAILLTPNVTRLLFILLLLFLGLLSLKSVLIFSLLGFVSGIVVGYLVLSPKYLFGRVGAGVWSRLLGYSKWSVLYSLLLVLYHRLDILILGILEEPGRVGIYSAAVTLAGFVYLFYEAALAVLLPNASRLQNMDGFRHFIGKSLKVTSVLSLTAVTIIVLAEPLIVLVYSDAYIEAAPLLRILCLGLIFTIVLEPLSVIILALGKPKIVSAVTFTVLLSYIAAISMLYPR